ncbi:LapA family protein [Jiella sp. MQZ9-1]|uniref:LapA family protein n=1 Tax=Jiella flava TaxID=2816857 RepID=A0A939FTZ4_9HYPH|nr:LapA family protein [Jiella flava]MBO0661512.1 LapA family protein [Jiella flava]MCD2470154.1 LapA family protein [Jiella flava]
MFAKIIAAIILIPIAIVLIIFMVVNRGAVPVSLDPFGTIPQLTFTVSLSVLLMSAVIFGLILGGIGTFLTQSHHRRLSSKRKREIERLKHESDKQDEKIRMLEDDRDRMPSAGAGDSRAMVPAARAA